MNDEYDFIQAYQTNLQSMESLKYIWFQIANLTMISYLTIKIVNQQLLQ